MVLMRRAGASCSHVVAHRPCRRARPRHGPGNNRSALKPKVAALPPRQARKLRPQNPRKVNVESPRTLGLAQALHFAPSPALRGRPDGRTALKRRHRVAPAVAARFGGLRGCPNAQNRAERPVGPRAAAAALRVLSLVVVSEGRSPLASTPCKNARPVQRRRSGNNSLRGGKKSYTRGALEGNWTGGPVRPEGRPGP